LTQNQCELLRESSVPAVGGLCQSHHCGKNGKKAYASDEDSER
jgi:hypothetical protein